MNIAISQSLAHATGLAAAVPTCGVVAALGGDGFIGAVAGGVRRGGAILIPLPGGRGNDLIRHLGWPRRPVSAAACVPGPRTLVSRRIDVGWVGDRAFLGVASVGLDAMTNDIANRTTAVRGRLVYGYAATRAIAYCRPGTFTVRLDDAPLREVRAWLIAIGNSSRYGGGLRICPTADLSDGWLDLVVIGPVPRVQFPWMFARIARGRHLKGGPHTHELARRIHVHAAPGSATYRGVFADGERIGTLPVSVTVESGALRVALPETPPPGDAAQRTMAARVLRAWGVSR